MRALRVTLVVIGIFQLFFGIVFLVAPAGTAELLGLGAVAPPLFVLALLLLYPRRRPVADAS